MRVFIHAVHRWTCRALEEERGRSLPGDDLMADPAGQTTHALTIDRDPTVVWPWVVQMGADRAGWYSHDWIDNGGRPSATVVLPEYQDLVVGDVVPALPGATDAFVVARLEAAEHLVLEVPGPDGSVLATWALFLARPARGHTRLLARARVASDWKDQAGARTPWASGLAGVERAYAVLARLPRAPLLVLAGVGHAIMQCKQLRGIKRRTERGGAPRTPSEEHLLAPYDPSWPRAFERVAAELQAVLGEPVPTIHHIGSTAVVGVSWSKPVLDVVVEVRELSRLEGDGARRLGAHGFEGRGAYGIPGRRYFVRPPAADHLKVHLHGFRRGDPHIQRHLAFRDHLLRHSGDAAAYARLKRRLAREHSEDRSAYQAGKAAFIQRIQAKASG